MPSVSMQTPNDLMVTFSNTVSAGFDALQGPINGVFGLMIVLVVALTGIQWALSSNREVLTSGFAKVLLIGFFAYLINDWERLSLLLQSGFVDLGLRAGGSTLSRSEFLNPGEILRQGWQIVKALGETPAPVNNPVDVAGNLTDALIMGLAMIGIMLAFAILALQIIVTLLEFKIVTLGGFVLLPFGIWSKSAFLAERPLGFVVSSGMKVLALAIVVSGARSVFDQLQPSANPDLYEALAILAASLLLAMLAIFIPNLASALVTGGPALGAGAAATGAMAVAGGGALAVAGANGLGAAAARIAGPSRAAAGAVTGRPPSGPNFPGAPSRPMNDNPPPGPRGGRPPAGGGMAEAPAAFRGAPTAGPPAGGEASGSSQGADGPNPSRSAKKMGREAAQARQGLQEALRTERQAPPRDRARRHAAAQSFFVANAGRSLLPGSETSGSMSPQLKSEDP